MTVEALRLAELRALLEVADVMRLRRLPVSIIREIIDRPYEVATPQSLDANRELRRVK